jgi:hypothetical protein
MHIHIYTQHSTEIKDPEQQRQENKTEDAVWEERLKKQEK